MSIFKKLCNCDTESAFYYDFGMYKCQYCDGILSDLDRVKKIIDYNTPTNIKNRNATIEEVLAKHKRLLKEAY